MARTPSAQTIDMIREMAAEAEKQGDRPTVVKLNLILGLITQLVNVTPRSPQYLKCEQCRGGGRIPTWFHAEGRYLDVYCASCQGSGETWNPHPECRHEPLRGEM